MYSGQRRCRQVIVCTLVVACLSAPVAIADTVAAETNSNEAPLPEAGLDQTVSVNDTVYLDARGSRDPDGSITRYDWEVESPGGATFAPDCDSCSQTHFVVRTAGTYNVTVTVTDDDGATRSDTLRVTVETVSLPSATLTGPRESTMATNTTFEVTASAGGSDLAQLTWLVNGSRIDRTRLSGAEDNATLTRMFRAPGTYEVQARIVSRFGRTTTATQLVNVTLPTRVRSAGTGRSGADAGTATGGCSESVYPNGCQSHEYYVPNSNTSAVILIDIDGDGKATYRGITYETKETNENILKPSEDSDIRRLNRTKANLRAFRKKMGFRKKMFGEKIKREGKGENNHRVEKSNVDNPAEDESDSPAENGLASNEPFGPTGPRGAA